MKIGNAMAKMIATICQMKETVVSNLFLLSVAWSMWVAYQKLCSQFHQLKNFVSFVSSLMNASLMRAVVSVVQHSKCYIYGIHIFRTVFFTCTPNCAISSHVNLTVKCHKKMLITPEWLCWLYGKSFNNESYHVRRLIVRLCILNCVIEIF